MRSRSLIVGKVLLTTVSSSLHTSLTRRTSCQRFCNRISCQSSGGNSGNESTWDVFLFLLCGIAAFESASWSNFTQKSDVAYQKKRNGMSFKGISSSRLLFGTQIQAVVQ